MQKEVYMIVAVDQRNGIGKAGKLPWNLHKDMQHFKNITLETSAAEKINAVVMGRNTWQSIPEKFRPLKGRKNIVLTRNPQYKAEGALAYTSFDDALRELDAEKETEKIFIIGGSEIFKQLINHPRLTGIYLTKIYRTFDCDVFFPETFAKFPHEKSLGQTEEEGVSFEFFLLRI